MAFFECKFFSESLGRQVVMNVIFPQKTISQIGLEASGADGKKYPCLYLLHGMSDDYSIWGRRTMLECYAASHELIIVMPDGARSFYRNMACGQRYKDFIADELPKIVSNFFPVKNGRDSTFIGGLSMGGYGALAIGLEYPERYAKICALSSVANVQNFINLNSASEWKQEMRSIFINPEQTRNTRDDLFVLAEECAEKSLKPDIFMCWGDEDFMRDDNVELAEKFKSLNYKIRSFEAPGNHSWFFWDCHIQEFLAELP